MERPLQPDEAQFKIDLIVKHGRPVSLRLVYDGSTMTMNNESETHVVVRVELVKLGSEEN